MLDPNIHHEIREGNSEAIGAAIALFVVLSVGGFLFYSLKTSDAELFNVQTTHAGGAHIASSAAIQTPSSE